MTFGHALLQIVQNLLLQRFDDAVITCRQEKAIKDSEQFEAVHVRILSWCITTTATMTLKSYITLFMYVFVYVTSILYCLEPKIGSMTPTARMVAPVLPALEKR